MTADQPSPETAAWIAEEQAEHAASLALDVEGDLYTAGLCLGRAASRTSVLRLDGEAMQDMAALLAEAAIRVRAARRALQYAQDGAR